jgi:uncharacterized protein with PIN domain
VETIEQSLADARRLVAQYRRPTHAGKRKAKHWRLPALAKVFDGSAVLAFLYNEPGGDAIVPALPDGLISAVNAAEVLAVLVRSDMPVGEAMLALRKTRLKIVEFGINHAIQTARMGRSASATTRRKSHHKAPGGSKVD